MHQNAEIPGQAVWASVNDPRVTTAGRIMRRFRLDELPQIWNVARGEMSIVGPRPERPEFIDDLLESVPYWSRRHLVKPGITGWAQVKRGYTADAAGSLEKLSYDLWYIRHRSLTVDLVISPGHSRRHSAATRFRPGRPSGARRSSPWRRCFTSPAGSAAAPGASVPQASRAVTDTDRDVDCFAPHGDARKRARDRPAPDQPPWCGSRAAACPGVHSPGRRPRRDGLIAAYVVLRLSADAGLSALQALLAVVIWSVIGHRAAQASRAMRFAVGVFAVSAITSLGGIAALSVLGFWIPRLGIGRDSLLLIALTTFVGVGIWDYAVQQAARAPRRVLLLAAGPDSAPACRPRPRA